MTDDKMRDALERIAGLARNALEMDNGTDTGDHEVESNGAASYLTCVPRSLPKKLHVKAAKTATDINPVNAPSFAMFPATSDIEITPEFIAVLTTKYWGPSQRRLTVSFLDGPSAELRRKIVGHMNAWNRTAGISFVETRATGQVRIARANSGYWSYLGTDVLHIASNRPTMNLQGFTVNTPDSEYKRVVRHETGHTLGCPHEHMRRGVVAPCRPEKAYRWFLETYGWDHATVDQQVLTPLDERSLMATPADQTSIMCYQLPGSITRDGKPILGGTDINATDFAFLGRVYPKAGQAPKNRIADVLDPDGDVNEDFLEEAALED